MVKSTNNDKNLVFNEVYLKLMPTVRINTAIMPCQFNAKKTYADGYKPSQYQDKNGGNICGLPI